MLPVLICSFLLAGTLAYQLHCLAAARTAISFAVNVEGGGSSYTAALDGVSYRSGTPSGLGRKRLEVGASDHEPFETNLFVWYSGIDLGTITLPHSRGTLSLDVAPTNNFVSVRGTGFQKELQNCSTEKLEVPTGEYRVYCRFDRFSQEKAVRVARNETRLLSFKPSFVALAIETEPTASKFTLESVEPPGISEAGATPRMIKPLPAGSYHLRISHDSRVKDFNLLLGKEAVTRVTAEFEYARYTLASTPPEADIYDGEGRIVGRTPKTFVLPPGEYSFGVRKPDFVETNLSVSLVGKAEQGASITLVSVEFLALMRDVRSQLDELFGDYGAAKANIDRALLIQPEDKEALRLKRLIEGRLRLASAKSRAQKGEFDAALDDVSEAAAIGGSDQETVALKSSILQAKQRKTDALNRPAALFQQLTAHLQDSDLFGTEKWKLKGNADDVRGAIVRSMRVKPMWDVTQNRTIEEGILTLDATLTLPEKKERAVFVISQPDNATVLVHCKFWDYLRQGRGGAERWVPLHRDFVKDAAADGQRQSDLDRLMKGIEAELP